MPKKSTNRPLPKDSTRFEQGDTERKFRIAFSKKRWLGLPVTQDEYSRASGQTGGSNRPIDRALPDRRGRGAAQEARFQAMIKTTFEENEKRRIEAGLPPGTYVPKKYSSGALRGGLAVPKGGIKALLEAKKDMDRAQSRGALVLGAVVIGGILILSK